MSRTDIAFPFRVDSHGRTADTGYDDHVRDMVLQLLFTSPGERVVRPEIVSENTVVRVQLAYVVLATGTRRTDVFEGGGP